MPNLLLATLICTGTATTTTPVTNIEIEVRPHKFSTIRYEFAEGSLAGTAYIQSLGHLERSRKGSTYIFQTGEGDHDTRLVVTVMGNHIHGSQFSHAISGMKNEPVDCVVEEEEDDHGEHGGH